MRIVLIGLATIALAGCTPTVSDRGQAVPEAGAIPPAACNQIRAEAYIGKDAAAIADQARAAAGAEAVRLIGPGQAVTQDYRNDRLNIETDATGRAVRVRCG